MKKIIIFPLFVIVLVGLFFYFYKKDLLNKINNPDTDNISIVGEDVMVQCDRRMGVWFKESRVCEVNQLSKEECIKQGGEFNECNSACRHNPKAEVCTMQCVLTCIFR